eukprot:2609966-Amphidinium_carterae.1
MNPVGCSAPIPLGASGSLDLDIVRELVQRQSDPCVLSFQQIPCGTHQHCAAQLTSNNLLQGQRCVAVQAQGERQKMPYGEGTVLLRLRDCVTHPAQQRNYRRPHQHHLWAIESLTMNATRTSTNTSAHYATWTRVEKSSS